MIAIGLIDDSRVLREGLTALLNEVPDLRVVYAGEAPDFDAIAEAGVDVLLLDIGLENGDSLEAVRNATREVPGCPVVVMDLIPTQEDIREFVEAGVEGFVLKDATLEELANTLRAVSRGLDVLPPQITTSLFSQIAEHAAGILGPEAGRDVHLTPREREVVNLIAEGLSNKKIAASLHISTHTVKSHVRNIMEKLTLHSRLQLATWAHHEGEARATGESADLPPPPSV